MTPVGFGRALRLGVSATFARAAPAVLLALAAFAATLCSTLLWLTGLASVVSDGARLRLAGVLLAVAFAWLLQAFVLGAAVQQAGAELRRQPAVPLLEAIAGSAPRALGWAVLAAAAMLAWSGWQLLVGGSGALLFVRGLLHHPGGLAGVLGLALVGTVGPLGALFGQLVAEMALVRAVLRRESPAVSGWEAAQALLSRPWAPVGLWLLTEVLAAAVSGTASAVSMASPRTPLRIAGIGMLLQLAIATLAQAVALLVRLGAFSALELDRSGELPAAPTPPPAPTPVPRAQLLTEAEPILEARAVDASPGSSG